MPENSIGARIRACRKQLGLSQAGLADLCGMSPQQLARMETGQTPNPGILTIKRVAAALGVAIDHLADFDASEAHAMSSARAARRAAIRAQIEELRSQL